MASSEMAITTDDLTKRYGETTILDGVNLQVPAGSVLGLLGPNGAGKTTAVRILTTLLRADSGRAVVAGFDVPPCPPPGPCSATPASPADRGPPITPWHSRWPGHCC